MIRFEISEHTFNRKSSTSYELSILHRMDSFAFMAVDEQRQVQLLRELSLDAPAGRDALDALYRREDLLSLDFRNVCIGLVTERFTLVPNRLFNPQEKSAYLEQLLPPDDGLEVRSDDLDGLAAQNVYAFPRDLLDFYRERHPGGRVCHCTSALLLSHRADAINREGPHLFVHVWTGCLQILFFSGRDLQLANTYPYRSAKDFLYHVLLIFDQFTLDPETTPLQLTGQILEDSEICRLLRRYVRRVETAPAMPGLHLGAAFAASEPHLQYDLFSLVYGA